jgi:hypothetical protein
MAETQKPKQVKNFTDLVEHFKRSTSYKKRNGIQGANANNYKIEKIAADMYGYTSPLEKKLRESTDYLAMGAIGGVGSQGYNDFIKAWKAAKPGVTNRLRGGAVAASKAPVSFFKTLVPQAASGGSRAVGAVKGLGNFIGTNMGFSRIPIVAALVNALDYGLNKNEGESYLDFGGRKNQDYADNFRLNQDNSKSRHFSDAFVSTLNAPLNVAGVLDSGKKVLTGEADNRGMIINDMWNSASNRLSSLSKRQAELNSVLSQLKKSKGIK